MPAQKELKGYPKDSFKNRPPLCFEFNSVLKTNVNVNANVNVKIDKPHAASQLNANVSVCVSWSEGIERGN